MSIWIYFARAVWISFNSEIFGAFQHSYLSAWRVPSKTKVQSQAFQDINRLIVPRGKGTWKTQADSEPFQKDAIRQSLSQIPLLRAFEVERGIGYKTGTQRTRPRGVKSSEVFYKELKASEENSCFKIKNKGRKTEDWRLFLSKLWESWYWWRKCFCRPKWSTQRCMKHNKPSTWLRCPLAAEHSLRPGGGATPTYPSQIANSSWKQRFLFAFISV